MTAKVLRFAAGMALGLLTLAAAPGAAAAEPEGERRAVERDSMPLKVANRTIIVLRGPMAGYTARERVASSLARIDAVLAGEHLPSLAVEDHEYGTRVLIGGKHAFMVTRVDVDAQAGETTRIVAQEAANRLERALAERREQETPRYLAIQFAFALLATLLYAAVLWLLYRGNGWIGRRLHGTADDSAEDAAGRAGHYFDVAHLLLFTRRVLTAVAWLAALIVGSAWLTFVLERFPYTRPWGEELEGNLLELFKEIALAIVGALPGLVFVVVIFLIARTIIRVARLFFVRVEQRKLEVRWLDTDTAPPTRQIFNVVVWLFALAMAYPYLPGAQTEAFKGLSVLAGLMVTIGASSVVGQAFSGLILMYTRAFRAGDYVRIGESEGTVMRLGFFATRLRTGLGEEVTLPNSTVMSAAMKNYSRAVPGTGYVVDTVVTIGYSTPWRQVHAMLEEAAQRTADIAADPAPVVRQTALSDFYVEYRLVAYTPVDNPERRMDALNRLHANIQDVFNEHGVQIMSPHYMTDPKEPQVVPKRDWYLAPARPPEGGPPA